MATLKTPSRSQTKSAAYPGPAPVPASVPASVLGISRRRLLHGAGLAAVACGMRDADPTTDDIIWIGHR